MYAGLHTSREAPERPDRDITNRGSGHLGDIVTTDLSRPLERNRTAPPYRLRAGIGRRDFQLDGSPAATDEVMSRHFCERSFGSAGCRNEGP